MHSRSCFQHTAHWSCTVRCIFCLKDRYLTNNMAATFFCSTEFVSELLESLDEEDGLYATLDRMKEHGTF
jgi:hypothetical protein